MSVLLAQSKALFIRAFGGLSRQRPADDLLILQPVGSLDQYPELQVSLPS